MNSGKHLDVAGAEAPQRVITDEELSFVWGGAVQPESGPPPSRPLPNQ